MKELVSISDYLRWLSWVIVIITCFLFPEWDGWIVVLFIYFAVTSETQAIINTVRTKKFNLLLEAVEEIVNNRLKP